MKSNVLTFHPCNKIVYLIIAFSIDEDAININNDNESRTHEEARIMFQRSKPLSNKSLSKVFEEVTWALFESV
jgi:hypothetical protein